MKSLSVSIAKKTTYIVATLIIIAALLVAASRIATPYLDAHRSDIEQWAGEMLHAPIKIENARFSWFQYQPGVLLQNVMLLDKATNQPVFQVQTIKVFFSIPQSLWQRKLVMSGILISGAELVVKQNAAGEYAVQGLPSLTGSADTPFQTERRMRDVLGWLSLQPFMMLRDIDVHYTNPKGQQRFFTLNNLRIRNDGLQHSIYGDAILHQDISTELVVAASMQGKAEDLDSINGKIHVEVKGLALNQWLAGLSYHDYEVKKGLLSAKIWASWQQGSFRNIQSSLELLNLDLDSKVKKHLLSIKRLSGEFGWKKEGKSQVYAGDDILIDWESRLWPVTSFYVKLLPNAKQEFVPAVVTAGYLDLADLHDIINVAAPEIMPAALKKILDAIQLKGNLENITLAFDPQNSTTIPAMVQGKFSNIGFKPLPKGSVISNLAGSFAWQGQEGSLTLQSHDVIFRQDNVFAETMQLSQLTGTILWQQQNRGHQLDLKNLQLMNRDISLNVNGQVMLDHALHPVADVNANFTLQNAAHVTRYLPVKIFSPELQKWLGEAFLTGSVDSGEIKLKGNLSDFPFDNNKGVFKITGKTHNIELHFAPDWPNITNIAANLIFSGRQILIDVESATTRKIKLASIHAEIPYLSDDKPAILSITSAPIQADFADGMNYLHQSPLENKIGRMFKSVDLTGSMKLTLALVIPLEDTDKTTVKGLIDFTDANLALTPWDLAITHLKGAVNFTEKTTTAAGVTGELLGKPLRLDLASVDKTKDRTIVQATVTNPIDLHDIETWLGTSFAATASGTADFVTKIDLAVDEPIQLHIDSNLKGIVLNVPAPYSKTADVVRPTTADLIMADNEPLKVKFNYADNLNAALLLDKVDKKFKLLAATLRLGKGDAMWPPENGLYITGTLPEVSEEQIKTYMGPDNKKSILPLRGIDMTIGKLSLYGVLLNQAKLHIKVDKDTWVIDINSDKIEGNITAPTKFNADGKIVARMDSINLDAIATSNTAASTVIAKELPAIDFATDSLIYDGADIGEVRFKTSPSASGLTVQNITVRADAMRVDAEGEWNQTASGESTKLEGKFMSNNISAVLSQLHFDARNFVAGEGKLNFDLTWGAPPSCLSLASLSGEASLNLGKGRIIEVSENSNAKMDLGRLLNLFSLQSIPRRLSLDFSDVFQKGYSFDSLRGDFSFTNGNASTSNMRFDGTIAKVEIRGRIGLVQKDIDLILSVTPYVTSSIPVAATLLTGQPVIGIAAWAVNKVVGSALSKAVTYHYSVAGTWSNPEWNMIQK